MGLAVDSSPNSSQAAIVLVSVPIGIATAASTLLAYYELAEKYYRLYELMRDCLGAEMVRLVYSLSGPTCTTKGGTNHRIDRLTQI